MFDFERFLQDAWTKQQEYDEAADRFGPYDFEDLQMDDGFRYERIIEMMGHLIEEVNEARAYVPRRSWRSREISYLNSTKNRKDYISELFDILLFYRAILAYSGIRPEEFIEVMNEKLKYNDERTDHNKN